jgi:branched-chain amino acid aminotransferase
VLPVTSIDGIPVGDGKVGPLTRQMQQRYFDLVSGRDTAHADWRTPVYA